MKPIDMFLHGTKLGMFQMEWDLVCPTCGDSVDSFRSLNKLNSHFYCSKDRPSRPPGNEEADEPGKAEKSQADQENEPFEGEAVRPGKPQVFGLVVDFPLHELEKIVHKVDPGLQGETCHHDSRRVEPSPFPAWNARTTPSAHETPAITRDGARRARQPAR